jgi:hypothetical protein
VSLVENAINNATQHGRLALFIAGRNAHSILHATELDVVQPLSNLRSGLWPRRQAVRPYTIHNRTQEPKIFNRKYVVHLSFDAFWGGGSR